MGSGSAGPLRETQERTGLKAGHYKCGRWIPRL